MGRVVGIDLGTTFSLIAYTDTQTGEPKCIAGPNGSVQCPSIVSIDENGKILKIFSKVKPEGHAEKVLAAL